ncbi:hypothetical protein KIPB_009676 [Kipferlia bialata]|uniref:Ribosome maturation protein SDO1/SBDS N-terminal domain-containing protein n=1 Tax=Kipferlia bialata TaxID=797122 RepID=A0A9K3D2S4_9EUKA|nr:hypothetical protein KIPB_009676 [Kipferlia bialata]|eukprot:g9676.t1
MSQVVSYKTGKYCFELLVKPDTILPFRAGKLQRGSVLFLDDIFTNASKGDRASEALVIEGMGCTGTEAIDTILKKGHFQLSTQERKKMCEEKRNAVITYFVRYYADPAGRPIPRTRIEAALDTIKGLRFDPFEIADRQAQQLESKVRDLVRMSKQTISGAVFIPTAHMGKVQHTVCGIIECDGGKYRNDGWLAKFSCMPGDCDRISEILDKGCAGDYKLKFYTKGGEEDASGSAEGTSQGGKKGKGKGKKERKGKK